MAPKASGGWQEALGLGLMFPASIVAGYLAGRVIGHWMGVAGETPALVGAALGVLGAFARLLVWACRER